MVLETGRLKVGEVIS